MSGIDTCLWFDGQAEEAADFYVAAFRAAGRPAQRGEDMRWPEDGRPLIATAVLDGHTVICLNGGPQYRPTPAVSFSVACGSQEEVDALWSALLEGGEPMACGWLTDRYGFSWQVFPRRLPELLRDPDRAKAGRVMTTMQAMVKIDLAALERAAEG
ncbi:VOC family protein [Roseomonas sp. CCTCC AB2023176]|uniref:VOC family protein n=1 Tax=Roseomonas sp. CCTCC AB2023176 TaxID=3342640 RepID=UPI0035DB4B58